MSEPEARSDGKLELISFEIAGQEFCIDIRSVREIRGWTPTTPMPHTPDYVLGVINLRGVVMPVLPGLIMHLGHLSVDAAAVWAGWLGAGYAALQFVFAPVIGNLSDRFGRRPVLLASLVGFGIDYLVMALAPSLWWLVLGRLAAGITGASWTAAYAFIADVSPPEKRAANFGLMGMAFGFGFIFGPALGGLLGTLGPHVPFLAAAAMAFTNAAVGWFVLKESLPAERRRPFEWQRANAFAALKAETRMMRDAKITQIYEGTNQIMKLIISRELLK